MESNTKRIVFPRASYTSLEKVNQVPIAGNVKGEIPRWLTGDFFRLGPGKFEVRNQSFDHWFDGFAVLHRFTIKQGSVTYEHKIIESDGYKDAERCGQLTNVAFGTVVYPDPCKSLFRRFMSYFAVPATDNCNVNLMTLGKDMFALTESFIIQKMDKVTLKKLETIDVRKYVPLLTMTPHPHTASDGTVYNIGTSVDYRIRYNIIKIPPPIRGSKDLERASVLCSLTCPGIHPSYYHSFGVTSNYIIFVEQPLTINSFRALTYKICGNAMDSCLDWDPSARTYFHLVKRDTGERLKTRFSTKAFFTMHHINAFEKDGHVVVDMCCYQNKDVLTFFKIKNMKEGLIPESVNRALRYVLPLKNMQENVGKYKLGDQLVNLTGGCATAYLNEGDQVNLEPEILTDFSIEVPQINYASYNGKPYRYFYGLGYGLQTLVKVDTKMKSSVSWTEVDWFPSEPVFVESPAAVDEDDGVILSSVIDLKGQRSPFLLILDAHTFTELARAEIPAEVVYGMHGRFVRADRA